MIGEKPTVRQVKRWSGGPPQDCFECMDRDDFKAGGDYNDHKDEMSVPTLRESQKSEGAWLPGPTRTPRMTHETCEINPKAEKSASEQQELPYTA